MVAPAFPEPDPSGVVIYVGQDRAGHWLVQDSQQRLEGRFISFAAAMSYARGERHLYRATVQVASHPLSPLVPFTPIGEGEQALSHAA